MPRSLLAMIQGSDGLHDAHAERSTYQPLFRSSLLPSSPAPVSSSSFLLPLLLLTFHLNPPQPCPTPLPACNARALLCLSPANYAHNALFYTFRRMRRGRKRRGKRRRGRRRRGRRRRGRRRRGRRRRERRRSHSIPNTVYLLWPCTARTARWRQTQRQACAACTSRRPAATQ